MQSLRDEPGLLYARHSQDTIDRNTVDLDRDSLRGQALWVLDIIFTSAFCIEAAMKIVVLGLPFAGPNSYLRSAWNCLDLFIAGIGVATIIVEATTGNRSIVWIRALRALRGLRLLRAASRVAGIRVVVMAFVRVLGAIAQVGGALLSAVIWLP